MGKITRRELLGQSALLMGTVGTGLPKLDLETDTEGAAAEKQKIVVVGAHPDDPESGCGGTIALYTSLGHEVVIVYLTRGEAGIEGKTLQEAAAIRTAESEKACAILKARPVFAGQIDGDTQIDRTRYADFRNILGAEHPDVVLTHWPIDSHRDHRAASLLVYDAWLEAARKFDLYYYEVDQGIQTQVYHPTHYVDITQTENRKQSACYAHASQKPEATFYPLHEEMSRFRGMECGAKYAEGFVRHCQNTSRDILEV
ncbi:MAG TPA: PIG-L family deacetylase [Candidatus Acidoferrum sp.]|nr:PIG-L family deacetylase [Candidatus Acidoferrum sp.]